MIRTLLAILVVGAVSGTAALADDTALGIQLTVSGAEPGKGQLLVSLFDSPASFLVLPILEATVAVDDEGNASVSFDGLQSGNYAIAVIYDENQNGKLDTGLFRIPKEKVGFSNNAKGRFGPAKWKDARFLLTDSNADVRIQLAASPQGILQFKGNARVVDCGRD